MSGYADLCTELGLTVNELKKPDGELFDVENATHVAHIKQAMLDYKKAHASLKAIDNRIVSGLAFALGGLIGCLVAPNLLSSLSLAAGVGMTTWFLAKRDQAEENYIKSLNTLVLCAQWSVLPIRSQEEDAYANIEVRRLIDTLVPVTNQRQRVMILGKGVISQEDEESSHQQGFSGAYQAESNNVFYSAYGVDQGGARNILAALWHAIRNVFASLFVVDNPVKAEDDEKAVEKMAADAHSDMEEEDALLAATSKP